MRCNRNARFRSIGKAMRPRDIANLNAAE